MRPTLPERRSRTAPVTWSVRTRGDGPPIVEGHAAVFNSPTLIAGSYREKIAPGAFRKVLREMPRPVPLLWNHNMDAVLASTRNGTLTLAEDTRGLLIRAQLIATSVGRDVALMLREGLVDRMSFAFTIARETWDDSLTPPLVTIDEVKGLYDVSVVTSPAYEDAEVALASLRARQQTRESPEAVRARVARALARHGAPSPPPKGPPVPPTASPPAKPAPKPAERAPTPPTAGAPARHPAAAVIVRSITPYGPGSEHSYFLDLARRKDDRPSAERLARHEAAPPEKRAISSGTLGGLVSFSGATWPGEEIAQAARAAAPLLAALQVIPLPESGMTANFAKVSTATGAGQVQNPENTALTEAGGTDPQVVFDGEPISTVVQYVDASFQARERGGAELDRLMAVELASVLAAKIESELWLGTGAAGRIRGLTQVSGLGATTTVGGQIFSEAVKKAWDAWQQATLALGRPPDIATMAPRRWAWLNSQVDTAGNQIAPRLPPDVVAASPLAPVNLGGGTEDHLFLIRRDAAPIAMNEPTLEWQGQGLGATSLTGRFVLMSYVAFAAQRRPEGIAKVTGMTTPSF